MDTRRGGYGQGGAPDSSDVALWQQLGISVLHSSSLREVRDESVAVVDAQEHMRRDTRRNVCANVELGAWLDLGGDDLPFDDDVAPEQLAQQVMAACNLVKRPPVVNSVVGEPTAVNPVVRPPSVAR